MKMEHALELLLSNKGGKIGEIAASIGFRNTSYFCRVFKNRYGMTPLQYRKRFYY
jgi:two-component system response regulator YesN